MVRQMKHNQLVKQITVFYEDGSFYSIEKGGVFYEPNPNEFHVGFRNLEAEEAIFMLEAIKFGAEMELIKNKTNMKKDWTSEVDLEVTDFKKRD